MSHNLLEKFVVLDNGLQARYYAKKMQTQAYYLQEKLYLKKQMQEQYIKQLNLKP